MCYNEPYGCLQHRECIAGLSNPPDERVDPLLIITVLVLVGVVFARVSRRIAITLLLGGVAVLVITAVPPLRETLLLEPLQARFPPWRDLGGGKIAGVVI